MTRGVSAEGIAFQISLLEKIEAFTDFISDNHPHGWHEFGEVEVFDKRVWFKIGLYDGDYDMGSESPQDITKTARVLTLLFPEEY